MDRPPKAYESFVTRDPELGQAQVVALAASTIGLPPAVLSYAWAQDVLRPKE
jgi:hypothetical protein